MRGLLVAEQIAVEHAVPHIEVQRQPVDRQHPVAGSEADGEEVVPGKLRVAHARDRVQRAVECPVAPDKRLARQQVEAQGQVVIFQRTLVVGQ